MIGTCGLCWRSAELRVSHLIPAGFYRLARTNDRRNPNPVVVMKGKARTTSKQIATRFLCAECERRFNQSGEDYILRSCSRGRNGFVLRDVVRALPTVELCNGMPIKGLERNEHELAQKCGYFAASVFWRASARQWAYDGMSFEGISLGVHEDAFRRYLLGELEFPGQAALMMTVSDDQPVPNFIFSPSMASLDGYNTYKLAVPGLIFSMFVGANLPDDVRHFSLLPAAATVLFGSLRTDMWFAERVIEMRNANRVGRFRPGQ